MGAGRLLQNPKIQRQIPISIDFPELQYKVFWLSALRYVRSIALPVLILFPFPFPAFLGPISAATFLPEGRPLLRAEPGVDASPRLCRMRWACDIVSGSEQARCYACGM